MTPKNIFLSIGAAAVAGVLIYLVIDTKNQQADTQAQLDAVKKQMATSTMPAAAGESHPAAAYAGPLLSAGMMPQDGSMMAKEKMTQDYLNEGFRLLNKRDPESAQKAAQVFQEGLEKADPKNVYFFNGLGRSLLIAGKPQEALEVFQRGRQADPKRAELASGMGWAYWNLKQYPEAKRAWEDAVELDPKSEDAWMVLSWVYMAVGNFEKSRTGFVTLLKIDPERKQWVMGLTMARASNRSIDQIRAQYKGMPDPEAFKAAASLPAGN